MGNVALGVAKIALGLGVTAESGGVAVGLGYYSAYSGVFNILAGVSQVYGAATGDLAAGETGANYAAAASSASGLITLAVTNGDAQAGATASTIEGAGLVGFGGGLAETGAIPTPGAEDNAVTVFDVGPGVLGLMTSGSDHP